jgi:hypothetical protein
MSDQISDQGPSKKPGNRKPQKARGGRGANEGNAAIPGESSVAVAGASAAGASAARTPWHEHKVAIIAITTLFTMLGGISLALFNSWRAPQELSATLAKPTIETNVTLSKGLEASNSPLSGLTEEQLALVGYLVHVQMKLVGFKGRHTRVRWELHDADTRARIFVSEYFSGWSDEQTAVDVLAEAAIDTAAPKFWVPAPPDNRSFFVRVMIYDDKGTELIYADSDAIRPTAATKPADTPNEGANTKQPSKS